MLLLLCFPCTTLSFQLSAASIPVKAECKGVLNFES